MDEAEMDAFVANISDTVSGRAAKTVIVALRAALAESERRLAARDSAWTDEMRKAVYELEDRFGIEIVSGDHHREWVERAESAEQERDRLRNGGCARDQRLTQHCTYAQAAEQAKQIAERDAARYQYLRSEVQAQPRIDCYRTVQGNQTGRLIFGEELDSAIDSTISAQLSGEER